MDNAKKSRLAREVLDGYPSGPGASVGATAAALERAETAGAVVLVEGISDQIALETLAVRRERDLDTERVVVVPMGGAREIVRHLDLFGQRGQRLSITGLYDAAEEPLVRHGLEMARMGTPRNRAELEELGFFVCIDDLEHELIRASSREEIEQVLASQGDLNSFRTLQRQPAWRGGGFDEQFHRWLRAGARRSLRYARLLTLTIGLDRLPRPLEAVLAASRPEDDS